MTALAANADLGTTWDCDAKTQRWLLFIGFGFAPLLFVGLLLIHALPLTPPTDSAAEVAHRYAENRTSVELGAALMTFGGVGWGLYGAVRTYWTWRMERGRFPFMALLSAMFATANATLAVLVFSLFAIVGYRAGEIDPELTRLFNDFALLEVLYIVSPMTVEVLATATAIFRDKQGLFPKWLAWVNIGAGVLTIPAGLIGFSKTGPFAWNGIIGFWLVMVTFGIWSSLEAACILRAISNEERARSGAEGLPAAAVLP